MKTISFKKMSLQYKLLMIFIALFVVPFIIFGIISYKNYEDILQRKTMIYNIDLISHIDKSIDTYVENIEKTAKNLANDQSFSEKIGKTENDYHFKINYVEDNEEIFSKISSTLIQQKNVMSIYLYMKSGISYCVNFEDTIDPQYSPQNETWYKQVFKGTGKTGLMQPRIDFQTVKKSLKVIPYIYSIKKQTGSERDEIKGLIQFNISPDVFEDLIGDSEGNYGNEKDIYVVGQSGDIIYSNRKDLISTRLDALLWNVVRKNREGSFLVGNKTSTDELVSYKTSPYTQWSVLLVTDNNQLTKDTAYIRTFTVLFTVVIIMLFVFISVIISKSISRPVTSLEKVIAQIETNKLDENFQIECEKSSGLLNDHYQKLIATINILLEKISCQNQKEREQERIILEEQINPHFIYNTLNAIRWLAAMQHSDGIANALKALINLLRSSIKIGKTYISIGDEVKQITDYIFLQQIRYYDSFKVEYDIDEDVKRYKTLKFVLQPIVENAIFHGVNTEDKSGKITIGIKRVEDVIQYCVKDNGKGMDPKTLSELLDRDNSGRNFNGIGVNNVNNRIRTYFGKQYGIEIESEIGCGTSVRIMIPAIIYEGDELYDKGINN